MENTRLSTKVTVKQYRELRDNNENDKIADFIHERFRERYLEPFENNQSKHGFSMIAIGCLLVSWGRTKSTS